MKNIILIGMPASGKSTIGVILAKTLGMQFIDTDILIQNNSGRLLQEIIDGEGIEAFIKLEGSILADLDLSNYVIATGGSAVYSDAAMVSLKNMGEIIYLDLNYEEIERRINNISTRGLVAKKGMLIRELYEERAPLYEKYADITVDCRGKDVEQLVEEITSAMIQH